MNLRDGEEKSVECDLRSIVDTTCRNNLVNLPLERVVHHHKMVRHPHRQSLKLGSADVVEFFHSFRIIGVDRIVGRAGQ